jgi:DNA ligase 1
MLKELQEFVNKMKSTSSLLEKKVIIDSVKDNKFITASLNYTYDPYKKYYVTSKTCKKNFNLRDPNYIHGTIFELLNDLNSRTYTGHDAIAMVNTFINMNEEYEDLIFNIIDRNIEIRASASVINKVIPNLIPTFDVALATKYEPKFCDFENEEWLGSRKLDGVRCIIRKEDDKANAYSRQGNEFTTLQKVLDDVKLMSGDFVLDGEICMMDEKGNEDFQGIMKQIKRKNHTIENPKYIIFDYLTLEEFDTKVGTTKLEERINELQGVIHHDGYYDTLSLLEQYPIDTNQQLSDMIVEADKAGYEGVMLRKNIGYEGKRTKNLLKCKKFFDAEYEVLSVDFDIHRIIKEGKEVKERMLSQVYIEHKGHKVAVGSGFNQEQRLWYAGNYMNESIVGKTITVQYFEETKNQEGGISLRFPTIKHIFENGRNV